MDRMEGLLTFLGITLDELNHMINEAHSMGKKPACIYIPEARLMGIPLRFASWTNCVSLSCEGDES